MQPLTRATLERVGVVTVTFANGGLSLFVVDDEGKLESVNLGNDDAPTDSLRHFATRYIAPRGSTELLIQVLSAITGQPFILEDLVEGAPCERHVRQDLINCLGE